MPAAARLGDTISTGHNELDCDATDATSTIAGALISKVKIDGIIAAVIGDAITEHNILDGDACMPHIATVVGSSSKVKFQGIYAARVGDGADGGSITSGSPDVIIG
jgi:uncharacterized Zn-binding protein involved in type VI secretion